MLLLITVMCVIVEKTLQVNIARLCCHNFYRWLISIGGGGAGPLAWVVDRWAGGSLTRRPKGPFAVSWPRQLGE